jgi:uncharacterized protein (DUF2267 family)
VVILVALRLEMNSLLPEILSLFNGMRNAKRLEFKPSITVFKMCLNLESDETEFLQLIKKELSFKTTEEVITRIVSILQAYRQTLSAEQATLIVNELPEYFKIAFITNWHYSEQPIKMDHLDQFVELVLSRDQEKTIFKSEVEVLSVSILVFKKLIELCKEKAVTLFNPSLLQQIHSVPKEAVAA